MAARDPNITELESKLSELKRAYDLFLAGQLRQEPLKLRKEIDSDIRKLTRSALQSTVVKFQLKTISYHFRALETQIKNLTDLKISRQKAGENPGVVDDSIVIDEVMMMSPQLISAKVGVLLKNVERLDNGLRVTNELNPETFSKLLVKKAQEFIGKNNVKAIKFKIVPGKDGPKVKGEFLTVQEPA